MTKNPDRIEKIEFLEHTTQEIGWFREIEVQFSFWHGGSCLKEGPTYCWPNEAVLQDAREAGRRICREYAIDASSTLELVAFRCDREVVKVRSHATDRHWHSPDSARDYPRNKIITCHRIWSSQTGDAPPPDSWPSRRVTFVKRFPIAGAAVQAPDLANRFFVGVRLPDAEVLRSGLAIGNGAIENLNLENVHDPLDDTGGRFAAVTGSLIVAADPRLTVGSEDEWAALVNDGLEIEAYPNGRGVHWDTTRITHETTSWALN
ncbi:hypothetical protein BSFA1_81040 (plasmid) [Burkholderia sp. SFA1]|nr:hypothetical protein BYI23_E001980 [Burkholderia sp. YI23]BBQ02976.1 hypothetical protein BSFA1_81040 [Burkholderia sp. SFA1]